MIYRAALCALFALAAPMIGAGLPEVDITEVETESTPPSRTQRWVMLNLNLDYPERRDPFNFFAPQPDNFRDLLTLIEEAQGDEEVTGMVLRIDSPGLGLSQVQSLRGAIQAFRSGGKQVIAYLAEAEASDYLVATACDEIVMAPEGMLVLTGIQLDGIFLRGLLDKLGVVPEIMQIGAYKGMGDMFTERAFTPAMREVMTALLDDLWHQLITTIASGRDLDADHVARLIDDGPYTASAAASAELIDRLAQPTDLATDLEITTGDGFELDSDYGEDDEQPMDTNIFNLFAMFQQPPEEYQPTENPKIALIYATGPIVVSVPDQGPFADSDIITSDDFTQTIFDVRDDDTIRAVVLRIDSPGGSALASDIIWQQLRDLARVKPVVVSMGNIAASGGYYIAMAGTEIFAEPGTLTGSIGVVGGKMVLRGLLEERLGITHDSISRGRHAEIFSPFSTFSSSERDVLQSMMQQTYDAFTEKVALSRNISPEQVEEVAQGRIWTGNQAVANRLIDHLGGLPQALERAEELAELTEQEREVLEIREFPPPENFMEWFSNFMNGETVTAPLNTQLNLAAMLGLPPDVQFWHLLFQEGQVLTLTPVMLSVH